MPLLTVRIVAMAASLVAPAIEAATLNKCIDAQGEVTYSNLPCRNAREIRKLEIDPPPRPDPVPAKAVATRPAVVPQPAPVPQAVAPQSVNKPQAVSKSQAAVPPVDVPTMVATPPTPSQEIPPAPVPQKTGKSSIRLTARQCDSLTNQLGKILDQMDQARRSGYSQQQMDGWEQEIKDIESKKQQSGCF